MLLYSVSHASAADKSNRLPSVPRGTHGEAEPMQPHVSAAQRKPGMATQCGVPSDDDPMATKPRAHTWPHVSRDGSTGRTARHAHCMPRPHSHHRTDTRCRVANPARCIHERQTKTQGPCASRGRARSHRTARRAAAAASTTCWPGRRLRGRPSAVDKATQVRQTTRTGGEDKRPGDPVGGPGQ
jgi:hypothetical protein